MFCGLTLMKTLFMKKASFHLLSFILLVTAFSLYIIGCNKVSDSEQLLQTHNQTLRSNRDNSVFRLSNGHFTCGDTITGSHTDSGYYQYTNDTLEFTSSSASTLLKIAVDAQNYPNRFTVYDNTGKQIVTSGWIGTANYAGPWGASLSTASTMTLAFTKGTISIYVLKVETYLQSTTDTWNAIINCSSLSSGGPGDTTCVCGLNWSGSYSPSGYYSYPNQSINLSCKDSGKSITLFCDPSSQPNRFTVYDINGNVVTTTGWTGSASYSGPWGPSLNNPGTHNLMFNRSGYSNYYTMKIETSSMSGSDTWAVSDTCQR